MTEKDLYKEGLALVGAAGAVGGFILLVGGSKELAIIVAVAILAIGFGVIGYLEQADQAVTQAAPA